MSVSIVSKSCVFRLLSRHVFKQVRSERSRRCWRGMCDLERGCRVTGTGDAEAKREVLDGYLTWIWNV